MQLSFSIVLGCRASLFSIIVSRHLHIYSPDGSSTRRYSVVFRFCQGAGEVVTFRNFSRPAWRWPLTFPRAGEVSTTCDQSGAHGAGKGRGAYCVATRTLIGNRIQSIEWFLFRWHSVTFDPDFKVTTFFDIECLRNHTR